MLAVISGWLKEQNKGGYAKLRASPPLEENRRSAQSKLIQASIKKRSVMTSRGHSRMRFITHTNRACAKNKMIQSSSSQQRQLTLEFLIAVGVRLLIFEEFSIPFALIRDPMLIRFCKVELNPMLLIN